jgi:glucosamine--fructose-6-phosphate aminotransferase (isomerizing)
MCGIVGYIGNQEACPILINGLAALEYRGYDSAGIAIVNDKKKPQVFKDKGNVTHLREIMKKQSPVGTTGIAHTRWATHGAPSLINAHPHVDQAGRIALVHNGIIENYASLK